MQWAGLIPILDATAETSNKRIKSEPQTKGKEPATENDKGKEIEVGGDDDGEEVKDLKEKEREELANKIIKETPDMVSPSDKARKRKVAVLLAYRGAGYSGMQRYAETIESEKKSTYNSAISKSMFWWLCEC